MDIEKLQGLLRKAIAKTLQIQDDEQATEQIDMLAHDAFEAARDVSYLMADWESKVAADGVTHPLEQKNQELKAKVAELLAELEDGKAATKDASTESIEDLSNLPMAVSDGPKVPSSDLIPVVLVGGSLDGKSYFARKDVQAIKVRESAGQGRLKKYVLARDAFGNPTKSTSGKVVFVSPEEPALMRWVRDVCYLRREIQAIEESQTRPLVEKDPLEIENKELMKRISELSAEIVVCNKDLADARHLFRVMEEDAKRPWVEDQPGDVELFGGPAHLNGGKMSSIKSTYKIPFRINSDSGLACYELAYDEHGDPRTIESRFVFVWTKNEPLISEKLIPGSDLPF